MTKIKVNVGERGKPDWEEVETMEVHWLGEDYVWFRFKLKNGQQIETLPLKGST